MEPDGTYLMEGDRKVREVVTDPHILRFSNVPAVYQKEQQALSQLIMMFTGCENPDLKFGSS